MLPSIAGHRAHIMLSGKCMLVVGIKVEQGVALLLFRIIIQARSILLVGCIHHTGKIRNILGILAFQDIIAQIHIELQILKAMHLVINRSIADRTIDSIAHVLQIKLSNRVIALNSHWRIAVHPNEIAKTRICSRSGTARFHRTRRIVRQSTSYHSLVHSSIVLVGSLDIEIQT